MYIYIHILGGIQATIRWAYEWIYLHDAGDHWAFPGDFTKGCWDFHPKKKHGKIAKHQLMKACCYFHKNEDDVTFFHCVFSMHCLVPGRILLFFSYQNNQPISRPCHVQCFLMVKARSFEVLHGTSTIFNLYHLR